MLWLVTAEFPLIMDCFTFYQSPRLYFDIQHRANWLLLIFVGYFQSLEVKTIRPIAANRKKAPTALK